MGAACTLGLVSCKDKGAEQWNNTPPPAQKEAPAEAGSQSLPASAEQQDLLNYMVFDIGKLVGDHAGDLEWHDSVRDMRNRLEEYYNTLKAQGSDEKTRMQLGLMLAEITRSMNAIDKALAYYNELLSAWEAQDEASRRSLEGRRTESSIANGIGACYLLKGKASEALPYYEKALEIDTAIFNELAPEDGGPLPSGDNLTPDLARAAEDILSSYRCLGDCQRWADDPEEARDTYKKGQELVKRMTNLNAAISLQYIRLLSAQGDLENSCGEIKKAGAAWIQAIQLAQNAFKIASSGTLRAKIRRDARKLETSIKTITPRLKEELEAAKAAELPEVEAVPAEEASEE